MTVNNRNGSFGDFEVLGKKFDEGGVSCAVVGFGAEVGSKLARRVVSGGRYFDDFFLGAAGLDGNLIFHTT